MQEKYFIENEKYEIRFHKRIKHFAIIIGETATDFLYVPLTHYSKKQSKLLELLVNPFKNDSTKSFALKRIRRAKFKDFDTCKSNIFIENLNKILIDEKIIIPFMKKRENDKIENNIEVKTSNNIFDDKKQAEENKKEAEKAKSKDYERER